MIIYIGENIPPNFPKGFDLIQSTMINRLSEPVNVRSIRDVYNKGIKDEDWIPLISKDKSCVITTDINIHRKKHLNELYVNLYQRKTVSVGGLLNRLQILSHYVAVHRNYSALDGC